MKTANDVLRWARSHLESVRHDLSLIDRGVDPHGDGVSPFLATHGPDRSAKILARLEGQEFVLERLILELTGETPPARVRKAAWEPFEKPAGHRRWCREGVEIRDEQGRPHPQRWAIVGPLPDGRKVTSNYAGTLEEAMTKGDEDVAFITAGYGKLETPEAVERRRGHTDAIAGHGPALFDGPYMIGYRRGRAEIGQPMEHKPAEGGS